ncbi:jg11987 [Pararge aegeria aegeria]|uniref:Jg11987 protein n=1 Tax=Pararge aegeria aegeria TaxID=348720 RepID=A0A8S4R4A5_9NEOP|nr:jg11987 [Pararge aegeria aegeria]
MYEVHATGRSWSTPNQVDGRRRASRGEPLETSGPESWSFQFLTKDLCPAVDFEAVSSSSKANVIDDETYYPSSKSVISRPEC